MKGHIVNTWKRAGTPDECDVWICPDCEWATMLEPCIESLDGADAPIDHGYNYCPCCGKKRLISSDEREDHNETNSG